MPSGKKSWGIMTHRMLYLPCFVTHPTHTKSTWNACYIHTEYLPHIYIHHLKGVSYVVVSIQVKTTTRYIVIVWGIAFSVYNTVWFSRIKMFTLLTLIDTMWQSRSLLTLKHFAIHMKRCGCMSDWCILYKSIALYLILLLNTAVTYELMSALFFY